MKDEREELERANGKEEGSGGGAETNGGGLIVALTAILHCGGGGVFSTLAYYRYTYIISRHCEIMNSACFQTRIIMAN